MSEKTIVQSFEQAREKVSAKDIEKDATRLAYHLMPPTGWLNDPNGLYQKDGIYHIFYQYAPESPLGNTLKGWGHYSSPDLIHFKEEEVTLFPDSEMDARGAYSGSAFVDGDTVHFFYTGNNKLEGDYDYINEGRMHWTNHFTTKDGVEFTEKETLMKNEDYPADLSNHVRDPKILKQGDDYYMVLGARTKDSLGEVLVFKSKDLKDWKIQSRILPEEKFGFMWECPDVFDLEDQRILITCPQGVDQEGILYENLYQNGYFEIDADLDADQKVKDFHELDNGFDFYAPQTFVDEKGRRILIGWMGIPDVPYTNEPSVEAGWQHALTIPRELIYKDGRLYQKPVEELLQLREKEISETLEPGKPVTLDSVVCEIQAQIDNRPFRLSFRQDCSISWDGKVFTLSLKESGKGRDARHLAIEDLKNLTIYSDTTSLEIFLNDGQHSFSTRLYDDQKAVLCSDIEMKITAWMLKGYEVEYRN